MCRVMAVLLDTDIFVELNDLQSIIMIMINLFDTKLLLMGSFVITVHHQLNNTQDRFAVYLAYTVIFNNYTVIFIYNTTL